jgi:hypothetical protein
MSQWGGLSHIMENKTCLKPSTRYEQETVFGFLRLMIPQIWGDMVISWDLNGYKLGFEYYGLSWEYS